MKKFKHMKPVFKVALLLFLMLPFYALSGCKEPVNSKPAALINENGLKEIYDISYYDGDEADSEKHKLNLFLPQHVKNPPVLLWIHGGAWAFGDRKGETALARKFAKAGIAVAAISYRLSPGTWKDPELTKGIQHPEHIKDVARAFAWIYNNAGTYDYDKHSIFVSGYSAGGHLSALLAMDPAYLTAVGRSVRDIKGAIPIAGAYDMEAYYNSHLTYNGKDMAEKHVKAVFGETMKQLRQASPTTYVKNQWIPMLVISEQDTYDYTGLFEKAAKAADYDTMEFYHVKDKNHGELLNDLARSEQSAYRAMIVDYIHKNKVTYRYLEQNNVRLAYKVFGKGEPLFLLNGGPGLPSHHFTDLAEKLAAKYQVILFDQRGTGYSSIPKKNNTTITLNLMVQDLEALRKHLGYDKITLMGQSFGGIYAQSYAAEHPQRVKKMILSHSGGMNMDFMQDVSRRLRSRLNDRELETLRNPPTGLDPDTRTRILSGSRAAGYVFKRELAGIVYKGLAFKSRFYPEVNALVFEDMIKNYDVSAKMKQFRKPVLIIHGDSDIVNPDTARYADTIFPDSRLLILKNCVHYGWLEHPDIYFKAIDDFLAPANKP